MSSMLREQTDTRLVTVVAVILRQTPLLSFQGYEVKDTNIPSKQCSAQRRNPGEKRGLLDNGWTKLQSKDVVAQNVEKG